MVWKYRISELGRTLRLIPKVQTWALFKVCSFPKWFCLHWWLPSWSRHIFQWSRFYSQCLLQNFTWLSQQGVILDFLTLHHHSSPYPFHHRIPLYFPSWMSSKSAHSPCVSLHCSRPNYHCSLFMYLGCHLHHQPSSRSLSICHRLGFQGSQREMEMGMQAVDWAVFLVERNGREISLGRGRSWAAVMSQPKPHSAPWWFLKMGQTVPGWQESIGLLCPYTRQDVSSRKGHNLGYYSSAIQAVPEGMRQLWTVFWQEPQELGQ